MNAICPGFIATPLAAVSPDRVDSIKPVFFAKAQPWPEPGMVSISPAQHFFVSEDAAVTGEYLWLTGAHSHGPELAQRFLHVGKDAKVAGVTKGSTGEAPQLHAWRIEALAAESLV